MAWQLSHMPYNFFIYLKKKKIKESILINKRGFPFSFVGLSPPNAGHIFFFFLINPMLATFIQCRHQNLKISSTSNACPPSTNTTTATHSPLHFPLKSNTPSSSSTSNDSNRWLKAHRISKPLINYLPTMKYHQQQHPKTQPHQNHPMLPPQRQPSHHQNYPMPTTKSPKTN